MDTDAETPKKAHLFTRNDACMKTWLRNIVIGGWQNIKVNHPFLSGVGIADAMGR